MRIGIPVFFLLCCFVMDAAAQEKLGISYSRQTAYLELSDKIEFVADVNGRHHLLSFAKDEKPLLFIFDNRLELTQSITLPFTLPERSDIRIVPFAHYYLICISSWYSTQYMVWKVDGAGNSTNLSEAFEKLLQLQQLKPRQEFQLTHTDKGLLFWYHTNPENTLQQTLVLLQADSALQPLSIRTVRYDFKRDEEHLKQEVFVSPRQLLVVKTNRSNSALELMKVDLSTSKAIKNVFYSQGFLYSQPSVNYDRTDSSFTVTAMLSDIGRFSSNSYIFLCRLSSELAEQTPVTILKKQFAKSVSTNFILVNHATQWIRFSSRYRSSDNANLGNISLYQDYIHFDTNRNKLPYAIRPVTTTMESSTNWDDQDPGIRFTLLHKNFTAANERRVANTKDAYTIRPEQYTRFALNGKEYMMVGQQFRRKMNGLLLVAPGTDTKLVFTDVRVNERRQYVVSKTKVIAPNCIIMPYLHKREAGLMKIVFE